MSVITQAATVVQEGYQSAVDKHGEQYASLVLAAFDCSQVAALVGLLVDRQDPVHKGSSQEVVGAISDLMMALLSKIAGDMQGKLINQALAEADVMIQTLQAVSEQAEARVH